MNAKYRILTVLFVTGLFCLTVSADVISIGSDEVKGALKEYKNKKFVFHSAKGKTKNYKPIRVRKLVLDKPTKVDLLRRGKKKPETVFLTKYERSKFYFKDDKKAKKEKSVSRLFVEEIEVKRNSGRTAAKGSDVPQPIQTADISRLENRSDLTEQEKEIVEQYKSASEQYNDFLQKSSEMVARMDKAQGREREKLLTELRLRKSEEQPVKREMQTARRKLLTAFPELLELDSRQPEPKQKERVQEKSPETAGASLEARMPEITRDNVILIDVNMLKNSGVLKVKQLEAIADYEEAAKSYQQAASTGEEEKVLSAIETLKSAQRRLFKAFPLLAVN